MKNMAISDFKAHALRVLDEVALTKEEVLITRHGKVLARVLPYIDEERKNEPGKLAATLVFEEDIVAPLGEEMWEASR